MNKNINGAQKRPFAKMQATHKCVAAALLSCSFIGTVQADSNVTVYGRVSGGLDYINNSALAGGGTGNKLHYGGNQWGPSFLGFKGSEDLGGGWKAEFNYENMLSSADGTVLGGGLWNRYAVVGLSSSTWGTLLLGKAMTLVDAELWALDPFGMQSTSIGTLVHFRNSGSRNNAITYNSRDFGGLSFRLQGELGETAGSASANRGLAGTVSYTTGNLTVKGVYEELRDANGNFTNLYGSSREYALGGSYQMSDWKLFAGASRITSDSNTIVDASNPSGSTENKMGWFGANYQVNPAFELLGAVYRTNLNKDGGHATLVALGGQYHLSKRTMLYGTVGSVMNKGAANFSVQAGGSRPLPGTTQQGIYTGVMHWF